MVEVRAALASGATFGMASALTSSTACGLLIIFDSMGLSCWGLGAAGSARANAKAQTVQPARPCRYTQGGTVHTCVQVCLSNSTDKVGVLHADRRASGCYVVDLTTMAKCLSQQRLPLPARVKSPEGQLVCMALLHLQARTSFWPLVRQQSHC